MEERELQDIFVKILYSELRESPLEDTMKALLTPDTVSRLYDLSKHHDLAHIISSSLYKNGLIADDEKTAKFSHEEMMSVYRHKQMEYTYGEICRIFDDLQIKYVPLKGSVIRPYYPKASMRTSCDIDILIEEENLESAVNALIKAGYKCGSRAYHDVSLYSSSGIHLELHFHLGENTENLDAVLKDAWLYARPVSGTRCEFYEDFFMFYIYAHMSYHFLSGGCGMRSLMDLSIIEHRMGITYRDAKALLEKAGIYKFAEEIGRLADACFHGYEKDELQEALLYYILTGGVYGSVKNKSAVLKTEGENKFTYLLRRLFPSYSMMSYRYPVLRKAPVLLPVYWGVRIVQMLLAGNASRSLSEMKITSAASDGEANEMKKIRDHLGL